MSQSTKPHNDSEKKEEQDEFEDEDEQLMAITPQEKVMWEKMMKSRIESMKKNHAEFQKWRDTMSRRRMFVYSRIRKLCAAQKDRLRFVLKMAETVRAATDINNNNTNKNTNTTTTTNNDNNDKSNFETDAGNTLTITNGADEADKDSHNSTCEKNPNLTPISCVDTEKPDQDTTDGIALSTIVEGKVMD